MNKSINNATSSERLGAGVPECTRSTGRLTQRRGQGGASEFPIPASAGLLSPVSFSVETRTYGGQPALSDTAGSVAGPLSQGECSEAVSCTAALPRLFRERRGTRTQAPIEVTAREWNRAEQIVVEPSGLWWHVLIAEPAPPPPPRTHPHTPIFTSSSVRLCLPAALTAALRP
ncbi:unnamed protein product [Gadus morhua 'NCC']